MMKVEIELLDHCLLSREPMECKAMGWLFEEHEKYIVLKFWRVGNEKYSEENDECLVIIKSAIKRMVSLTEDKVLIQ